MNIWRIVRQINYDRNIYNRYEKQFLRYIYKFPGREVFKIFKLQPRNDTIIRYSNLIENNLINIEESEINFQPIDKKPLPNSWSQFGFLSTKQHKRRYPKPRYFGELKSRILRENQPSIPKTKRLVFPSSTPTNDGLWLVNPKTGVLLRPKYKIEDIIGRFYRKGEDVFIALPNNKVYELVNGFEYGAKSYSRDRRRKRFSR